MKYFWITLLLFLAVGSYYALAEAFWAPQFFPLDNPLATYRITKGCPAHQGGEKAGTIGMKYGGGYCVEYTGGNVFDPRRFNTNFYRITVGTSRQDLRPFLNKKVSITSGSFESSDKQCIAGACVNLGGTGTVLNLNNVELQVKER